MSESKKCPKCRLINPKEALLCDCGYNLNNEVSKENDFKFYAGFWMRVLAYTIDIIPIMILVTLFYYFFTDIKTAFVDYLQNPDDLEIRSNLILNYRNGIRDISGLIWILYSIIFDASPFQGTLGKRLLKIKVTNIDGSKITVGKSIARNLLKFLSVLTLGIGFIMSALTKKKQCLHDIIAKTEVIKSN